MPIDSTTSSKPPLQLQLKVGPSGVQGGGSGLFLTASTSASQISSTLSPSLSSADTFITPHPTSSVTTSTVVPKGTLLGWYGGMLLTPSEWVRKYAGGHINLTSTNGDLTTATTPNPADYTFHTPLGPLAWMCREGGDVSPGVGGATPPSSLSSGPISIRLVTPQIHDRGNTSPTATSPEAPTWEGSGNTSLESTTCIAHPYSSILGHYMNDICGLVVVPSTTPSLTLSTESAGNEAGNEAVRDMAFKEMVRTHITAAWGTPSTSTPVNNAVVLKEMVFEVVLPIDSPPPPPSPSSYPACMGVTHVCPVVAAVDFVIPPCGEVELTTSYGAPFWISRLVSTLFYNHQHSDGSSPSNGDIAVLTEQQRQQRGWKLARWVREYYVLECEMGADEGSVASLPCAVAVARLVHKGDNIPTPQPPHLFISRTANAPFTLAEECDKERLQHVLAAFLNHDPAVYKLPAAAVTTLLIRLCPLTTTTSPLPPLPEGYSTIGTFFYSPMA